MKRTRVFASIGFVSLAVLQLSANTALAQATVPTYTDLTSIADPDAKIFGHWVIFHTLAVPTDKLQKVINAQTGSANFVALSNAGQGLSTIDVFINFERIQEGADGELAGPYSDLIISTTLLDLALGTTQASNIFHWASAPEGINELYGSEVATPAEFRWDIEQEGGLQAFKVKVRGSDGFRETVKVKIPQSLGFRVKIDPVPGTIRYLSDGPGGAHPAFAVALALDVIPIDPGQSTGFKAGEFLKLPGGKLRISEVVTRLIGRGTVNHIDVE